MSSSEYYKALVSLLDDEDKEIVSQVEDKILCLGSSIIPFLESKWENNLDSIAQKRLRGIIHVLQYNQLGEKLVEWKKAGAKDLLEGMWIIATYQYPNLELNKLKQELEYIYREVGNHFMHDLHPLDQIKAINAAVFGKLKFKPNTKDFNSPEDSMINMVLESRRGSSVSLCVIYVLIAQKLGVMIYGVNLPNMFITTYKDEDVQFYMNIFNRGLVFYKADIDNYINHLHLSPHSTYYEPCSHVEIIKHVLGDLVISFEKLNEHKKADEMKMLLSIVSKGDDYNEGMG